MQISVAIRFWEIIVSGKSEEILPFSGIGRVFVTVDFIQGNASFATSLCRNTSYTKVDPIRRAKNSLSVIHIGKIIVSTITIGSMDRFTALKCNYVVGETTFNIFGVESSITKQQKMLRKLLTLCQGTIPKIFKEITNCGWIGHPTREFIENLLLSHDQCIQTLIGAVLSKFLSIRQKGRRSYDYIIRVPAYAAKVLVRHFSPYKRFKISSLYPIAIRGFTAMLKGMRRRDTGSKAIGNWDRNGFNRVGNLQDFRLSYKPRDGKRAHRLPIGVSGRKHGYFTVIGVLCPGTSHAHIIHKSLCPCIPITHGHA